MNFTTKKIAYSLSFQIGTDKDIVQIFTNSRGIYCVFRSFGTIFSPSEFRVYNLKRCISKENYPVFNPDSDKEPSSGQGGGPSSRLFPNSGGPPPGPWTPPTSASAQFKYPQHYSVAYPRPNTMRANAHCELVECPNSTDSSMQTAASPAVMGEILVHGGQTLG